MKNTASIEIYDYWDALRGGRAAPSRNEIEPTRLRHLLPDLFILSEGDNASPTFRLTGTRLYNLFGRELRDTPFSSIWDSKTAQDASRISQGVMQHELPVLFDISAERGNGYSAAHFEMLLLPLQTEEHFPSRLLGALIPDRKVDEFSDPLQPLILTKSRMLHKEPENMIMFGARPATSLRPISATL